MGVLGGDSPVVSGLRMGVGAGEGEGDGLMVGGGSILNCSGMAELTRM